MRNSYLRIYFLLLFSVLFVRVSFSQVEDEKQERQAQKQMLQNKPAGYTFFSSAALFSGYDNNVRLVPNRKGSSFQESLYSLSLRKPLADGWFLNLYYDLDYLNYSSITDSSNLMNHLKLDLNNKLNRLFVVGGGYDFSDFYYPHNDDGNFVFHKGFVYLKNTFSRKAYQQLLFEYGYKHHLDKKALGESLSVLKDNELDDWRQSLQYSIGANVSRDLYLQLRTKFTANDSNAGYQDFYNYKSWEFSPALVYNVGKATSLIGSYSYTRKLFSDRIVSTGTKKEKDSTHVVNVGVKQKINKKNTASLFYTYRDNSTNEPLERFTESVFTCGWEYSF